MVYGINSLKPKDYEKGKAVINLSLVNGDFSGGHSSRIKFPKNMVDACSVIFDSKHNYFASTVPF